MFFAAEVALEGAIINNEIRREERLLAEESFLLAEQQAMMNATRPQFVVAPGAQVVYAQQPGMVVATPGVAVAVAQPAYAGGAYVQQPAVAVAPGLYPGAYPAGAYPGAYPGAGVAAYNQNVAVQQAIIGAEMRELERERVIENQIITSEIIGAELAMERPLYF